MGKKRVAVKSEEELLKETEKIEEVTQKALKVKVSKRIELGKIYISSSYNNTIITITDPQGNTLGWVSAGKVGFKGTKKSTPYAASKVAEAAAQLIKGLGIARAEVYVKGIGSGRDSAIRTLAARGIEIDLIKDITPVPHNGCRPPKVRRV